MMKYIWSYFLLFNLLLVGIVNGQTKREITLDDIFKKPIFGSKDIDGLRSLNDGKTYVSIKKDSLSGQQQVVRYRYVDGKQVEVLYREADIQFNGKPLPIGTNFSKDESKVLLSNDEEKIYRHSFRANYFVYDLKNKKLAQVSTNGKQLYATMSPDGSKVAFMRDNNLFIKDLLADTEQQITNDGVLNQIINGAPDWVYEEEFGLTQAFFWSSDSKRIAFYRFDEKAVPQFDMSMYDGLYPSVYRYKYPKAGEKNATVSIHVYDLTSGNTQAMETSTDFDQYLPKIQWTADPNMLCIMRMNRHQDKLEYLLSDVSTGKSRLLLTRQSAQYVDLSEIRFLKNKMQFLLIDDVDGFNHLYLYDISGKLVRQLTHGNWEVTQLFGADEARGVLYYQSVERSPLQQDLFVIGLDGKNKKRLSILDGDNNASFNSDFSYYILRHSDHSSPMYISLHERSGKQLRVLEDNSALKKRVQEYQFGSVEYFQMNTSENVNLNGYMIKPFDFDPAKKYPVLMYVYGGPGSQQVADNWSGSHNPWAHYLTQKGYIIVCVDNRGTGLRGAAFRKANHKELGKYETIDQIEVAKWLGKKDFVDPARIGIWGWSFGGYLSSLCITKGADVFAMAIAVAPVTNWRYYDSIYTERYLQTPQENPKGYDENSPINFVDKLKGKFLLIHGTADDNVHFQNSLMFSEALIQANKSFEQAYYPNKNHGIYGANTRWHLYLKMTDFILKNL